jgi:hypothetical protein
MENDQPDHIYAAMSSGITWEAVRLVNCTGTLAADLSPVPGAKSKIDESRQRTDLSSRK